MQLPNQIQFARTQELMGSSMELHSFVFDMSV